jgi:hypothetical protein
VIVDNDKAYQDWLGQQSTFAQLLARAETGKERLALAEPVAKSSLGGQ